MSVFTHDQHAFHKFWVKLDENYGQGALNDPKLNSNDLTQKVL